LNDGVFFRFGKVPLVALTLYIKGQDSEGCNLAPFPFGLARNDVRVGNVNLGLLWATSEIHKVSEVSRICVQFPFWSLQSIRTWQ
jgi:hypothetical protein